MENNSVKDKSPARKVLIVDDDRDIRSLLHTFLTSKGIICETAYDGKEALEKISASGFNAVITDIKMPGMDGIALTREIIGHNPDIFVMIMTGYASEFSEEDAINAGARDFITKPFSLTEFNARFTKMMRDIKELNVLSDLAHFDVLTGLPNRKLFFDRLNQSVESAKRYSNMFALMYVDIDHFKDVNDRFGHDAGDLVLKEAAARLMECVRGSDTVARMGGDEFTIILTKVDKPKGAEKVAQRIVSSFSKKFSLSPDDCSVSASVGISLYPSDADDTESLLKKADTAMYRAKAQGRNNYQFYDTKISEQLP